MRTRKALLCPFIRERFSVCGIKQCFCQGSSVVEQRTHKPLVGGSTPLPGTKLSTLTSPFNSIIAPCANLSFSNALKPAKKANRLPATSRPATRSSNRRRSKRRSTTRPSSATRFTRKSKVNPFHFLCACFARYKKDAMIIMASFLCMALVQLPRRKNKSMPPRTPILPVPKQRSLKRRPKHSACQ